MSLFRRLVKFQTVGALGIVVQLLALVFFKSVLGLHYMTATVLAVEIAVLHNFYWHERWTWVERTRQRPGFSLVMRRMVSFNLTTGLVSIVSNLVLMRLLVGQLHLNYLIANLVAIATAALANFLFSELFVFKAQRS